MMKAPLTFLKLGGSLITDKHRELTPQLGTIQRIAAEIHDAINAQPNLPLLIGHGSGSFGHAVAVKYQTQNGEKDQSYWRGFAAVWAAARELNQIIIESHSAAGLPVIAFPPSAAVISRNKELISWETSPLEMALAHQLIPVVQGDVVFDTEIGGTIFSTEQVFQHLCKVIQPGRILIAGLEQGVYFDHDKSDQVIPRITPGNFKQLLPAISGAKAADVTGGMLSKVRLMLDLVSQYPALEVQIFSGMAAGNIEKALSGSKLGTLITHQD